MYYTITKTETTLAEAVKQLREFGGGCIYCTDGRIVAHLHNGRVCAWDESITP